MNETSRTRSLLTDFAASLAMAVTIGIATSVTLAGAVLLIAGHSASAEQPVDRTTS